MMVFRITRVRLAIVLALLVPLVQSAAARTLDLAVPGLPDRATQAFLDALTAAEELKAVGLRIQLKIVHPESEQSELITQVQSGRVQLALVPIELLKITARDDAFSYTSLLAVPSALESPRELFALQDSTYGSIVAAEIGKKNLLVLAHWNRDPVSLLIKRRITNASELSGLRIGSMNAVADGFFHALKASPIRVPADPPVVNQSRYLALEKGEISAAEWTLGPAGLGITPAIAPLKYVHGGAVFANFRQQVGFLVANPESLLALTEVERLRIAEAATRASLSSREVVLRSNETLAVIAKDYNLALANFSALKATTAKVSVETVWLQQVGPRGREALELLKRVRMERRPQRELKKGEDGSRRSVQPRIIFATVRNDENAPEFEHRFGARLLPNVPLTCGETLLNPAPPVGSVQRFEGSLALKPNSLISGEQQCVEQIARAAEQSGGRIVVFVHGFGNSFGSALRRYAGIAAGLGISVPGVVWAWPSVGDITLRHVLALGSSAYHRDEEAVRLVRERFVRFLRLILGRKEVKQIVLFSHSMGGRLGAAGLEAFKHQPARLRAAIFAAPDEAVPIFVEAISEHNMRRGHLTLYASGKDYPLFFSRRIHATPRAGEGGPDLVVLEGLESVDATAVDRDAVYSHWYVIDAPEVAADLSKLINQGLPATLRSLRRAERNQLPFWIIDRARVSR